MRKIITLAVAAALSATAAMAQGGMDPATIFAQLDTDKNGSISKEEFAATGRPADRFDLMDADKDGKVTQAEFTDFLTKMMQQRQGG